MRGGIDPGELRFHFQAILLEFKTHGTLFDRETGPCHPRARRDHDVDPSGNFRRVLAPLVTPANHQSAGGVGSSTLAGR